MSQTIWKFGVPIDDEVGVKMPKGAVVLSVQVQHDQPTVWALVDTEAKTEVRSFHWRGTGHPADGLNPKQYVGTIQVRGGALVFHLFEGAAK